MRTLVIDSATAACSVALFDGDTPVTGEFLTLGRGHAEQLVPMIARLPGKGRADRIAVALGPGSFTGVRVGLAAARALAFAWSASLVGYPTLALVAAMARDAAGGGGLAVAMTGGHGEWFVQRFSEDGLPLGDVASLGPDAAANTITETHVAGSEAETLVATRGFGHAATLLPDARAFALLGDSVLTAAVTPVYGRTPDAKLPGRAA